MNEGKRGPNGGVIDIDDPYELPDPRIDALRRAVAISVRRIVAASEERAAKRESNVTILTNRAVDDIVNAIVGFVDGEKVLND